MLGVDHGELGGQQLSGLHGHSLLMRLGRQWSIATWGVSPPPSTLSGFKNRSCTSAFLM